MKTIAVEASKKYDVLIGDGLLREAGKHVAAALKCKKLCLVSDDAVFRLYGEAVSVSLAGAGNDVCAFTFAPGEKSKNMDTLRSLLECLAENQLTRSDAIIALGGGVTGDLAGFAASCYLRGIDFVQIPTTLLAAVDSSVGGKTGVNLAKGKNLAGAFWQPSLVICDCGAFATLADEALRDGIAEVIKYGVISDGGLFEFMLSNNCESLFNNNLFEQIIEKCVTIKACIVNEDERDLGKRQILNFGHTLGHAIEKLSDYGVTHGQAVALGMLYMTRAAERSGISPAGCAEKIEQALTAYGFSLDCPYSAGELCEAALIDKKRAGDYISLVIPDGIGSCRLEKFDIRLLKEFVGGGF